jgi:ribonuclease HI
MKYIIYTDGACSGNPGPGGWGAVIFDERKKQHTISGKVKDTTNNRMELLAPIMALKKIKSESDVVIFTDSTYVKNGITEWIKKWETNGWKNSNRKPVKNKDLWVQLNDLCQKNKIVWKWVKGHSNNKYNNLADELATLAIKN